MILTIMISNIDILPGMSWENVSGWGLVNKSKSLVYYAKTLDDCIKVIQFAKANGLSLLSSGKGYTFGDMIINHQNISLNNNIISGIITPDKDIIPDAENFSPAYLIFENYELILKWNRSLRFALAVCTLKNEFKNAL